MTLGSKQRRAKWGTLTAPRTPKKVETKHTVGISATPAVPTTKSRITAPRGKPKRVRVKEGMTISFSYKKLNGEAREVANFAVDNVFDSKAGHRIIQGWREDGTGHSYRRYRMTDVVKVKEAAE